MPSEERAELARVHDELLTVARQISRLLYGSTPHDCEGCGRPNEARAALETAERAVTAARDRGHAIGVRDTEAQIVAWLRGLTEQVPNPDINPRAFALQVECMRTAAALIERGDHRKGADDV